VPDHGALSPYIAKALEWLQRKPVYPQTLRYTFQASGLLFQVDFEDAADATGFATLFPDSATRRVMDSESGARKGRSGQPLR